MGKFFFVSILVRMIRYVKILPLAKLQPANQAQFKRTFWAEIPKSESENVGKFDKFVDGAKLGRKGQELVL